MRASFLLPQRFEEGKFYPEPPLQSRNMLNFYQPLPSVGTSILLGFSLEQTKQIYYRIKEWGISWFLEATEESSGTTATSSGSRIFPAQGINDGGITKQIQDERYLGPGYGALAASDEANLATVNVIVNPLMPPQATETPFGLWTGSLAVFASIQVGGGISEAATAGSGSGPQLDFFGFSLGLASYDDFNYPMTGFIQIQPVSYWPYALPDGSDPYFNSATGEPIERT